MPHMQVTGAMSLLAKPSFYSAFKGEKLNQGCIVSGTIGSSSWESWHCQRVTTSDVVIIKIVNEINQ